MKFTSTRAVAAAIFCSLAFGSTTGLFSSHSAAWAQPTSGASEKFKFPEGISLLQKTCIRHAALRTGHARITANLPDGWKEESELWFSRPGQLHFASKLMGAKGGEPIESHVICLAGKVTIWSSQPNPDNPAMKNVYMRMEAPPDVIELDGAARFGIAQFILRLLSGEPNRLAGERIIKGLAPDQLGITTKDGQQQDELTFDIETGLLKSVKGRAEGQIMATGEINYVSVDTPLEPNAFDWKLPAGAREIKPKQQ